MEICPLITSASSEAEPRLQSSGESAAATAMNWTPPMLPSWKTARPPVTGFSRLTVAVGGSSTGPPMTRHVGSVKVNNSVSVPVGFSPFRPARMSTSNAWVNPARPPLTNRTVPLPVTESPAGACAAAPVGSARTTASTEATATCLIMGQCF